MKYYCWDCHRWLGVDEKHDSKVDENKLQECREKNHDISEYEDSFNPAIGK